MVWAKRVPDGFMLLCNDLAAEMGGTTRKLMEGTFPERWWPADFTKKWLMDDNEVASSGRPKENFYEKIIHPKSGQIRWVRTSKFPLMDAFGKVVAVLVFAYDVTDIVPADVKNGRA
jgi:PAS domain S-box-containing protein